MTLTVAELAYLRLGAPDLNEQERFLNAFGLVVAARTRDALYLRGTGAMHHLVVVEEGPPAVKGVGFALRDQADLERARSISGASSI